MRRSATRHVLNLSTLVCFTALPAAGHAQLNVKVHDDAVAHVVDERFDGTNFVALWHQAAPDSAPLREAFARLSLGLLRFPGGVPAHYYDWEQPLKSGWTEMTSERVWDFADFEIVIRRGDHPVISPTRGCRAI